MRRGVVLLSLLLIACQIFSLAPARLQPQPTSGTTFSQPPTSQASGTFEPRLSPAASLPAGLTPPVQPRLTGGSPAGTPPINGEGNSFTVRFHPDGALYVGDQVSLEVIAPANGELLGRTVILSSGERTGDRIGEARFGLYGLGGRIHRHPSRPNAMHKTRQDFGRDRDWAWPGERQY